MKKARMMVLGGLFLSISLTGMAGHSFIEFDDAENMVLSGPFEVTIPKPAAAVGALGPEHSTPSFLDEDLKVSRAAFYASDQFIVVQVEQTNAGPGRLTNKNLPAMELAGEEFRAREACLDISQEELDANDDSLFEFIEEMNVQIVPAVQAMQLFSVSDDGTAEGIVLFLRNVPGGCDSMSDEFHAKFKSDFEKFIESVRAAN